MSKTNPFVCDNINDAVALQKVLDDRGIRSEIRDLIISPVYKNFEEYKRAKQIAFQWQTGYGSYSR